MNNVILTGRLTKEPTIISGKKDVAHFTLAVDRYSKDGEDYADFISCVSFGHSAKFVDKYIMKGDKIAIKGRLHSNQYKNKNGDTVYTTEVITDEIEFAQSKKD